MPRPLLGISSLGAALAAAIAWTPAIAQEAPAPAPAAEPAEPAPTHAGGIEEIVVTARRRVESQQDVPVSVTALSGDELTFNTVQDVMDIEKSVPGIQIRAFGARTSTAAITMRGQQAGSDVSTVDGAVGVYINEVYVAREKGLNQSLFDIDSVQVLRGPQGTLFGRNTTGGALLVSSKLPEEEFGGYLKALTGDYARYGGEGALNVPLGETVGARVAFSIARRNGYSERDIGSGQPFVLFGTDPTPCAVDGSNCTGGRQDVDDESSNAWRFSLVWEPTDEFSSRLVHDGFISNTNGAASFITNVQVADPAVYPSASAAVLSPFVDQVTDPLYIVLNANREGANFGAPPLSLPGALITAMAAACANAFGPGQPLTGITGVLFPTTQGLGDCLYEGGPASDEQETHALRDDRRSTSDRKQRGRIRSYGVSWVNEYDFDWAVGKLILGYRDINVEEDFDLDGTANAVLFTEQFQTQDQVSAELLFNGLAFSDALDWTAGVYFFKEDGNDGSFSPAVERLGSPIGGFDADFEHTAYSFYGNGVFHLTEEWNVTAGYRYSTDKREMVATHKRLNLFDRSILDCGLFASDFSSGPNAQRLPLSSCRRDAEKKFHAHTGQVGVQWQPTDTFQTYLNWRRGYRSGGFNLRAQTPSQFAPFDPEYVDDFELGLKADYEIGSMPVRTNLAVFYDLYKDAQRSVIKVVGVPPSTSLQTLILNAADATIYGGELEIRANPIDALELRFGAAAAIARYDEFIEDTPAGPFDRSDQHFIAQPDFTVNASARYTLPITELFGRTSGDIALQLDWVWYDDTLISGPQGPGLGDNEQDAYSLVDVRMDWSRFLDSPFDLSFYVRNIADKHYAVSAVNFQNSTGFDVLLLGPPRLIGGEITFRF